MIALALSQLRDLRHEAGRRAAEKCKACVHGEYRPRRGTARGPHGYVTSEVEAIRCEEGIFHFITYGYADGPSYRTLWSSVAALKNPCSKVRPVILACEFYRRRR